MRPVKALAGALGVAAVLSACAGGSDPSAEPVDAADAPSASPAKPSASPEEEPADLANPEGATPEVEGEPSHLVLGDGEPGPLGPAPANTCAAAQLTGVEADRISAGSSTKVLYVLRTSASEECRLVGYPEITMLDVGGEPMPVRVTPGGLGEGTTNPEPHTLAPESSLSFFLTVAHPESPASPGTCPTTTTVRVALPETGGELDIASEVEVCAGEVVVTPVQALVQASQLAE